MMEHLPGEEVYDYGFVEREEAIIALSLKFWGTAVQQLQPKHGELALRMAKVFEDHMKARRLAKDAVYKREQEKGDKECGGSVPPGSSGAESGGTDVGAHGGDSGVSEGVGGGLPVDVEHSGSAGVREDGVQPQGTGATRGQEEGGER